MWKKKPSRESAQSIQSFIISKKRESKLLPVIFPSIQSSAPSWICDRLGAILQCCQSLSSALVIVIIQIVKVMFVRPPGPGASLDCKN